MMIRLNKTHFPVTALGPGRRIGIWMQGCGVGCSGCVSRDTWPAEGARPTPIDELLAWCRDVGDDGFDGVTISGGEPFEQPQALRELVEGLAAWRERDGLDFDVLAYSGLAMARLRGAHAAVLAQLDAVVAGPFVRTKAPGAPWWGSANQELTALSERGRRIVRAAAALSGQRQVQVSVDEGAIWLIGIPQPGDLDRLEAAAGARGLKWREASWRA